MSDQVAIWASAAVLQPQVLASASCTKLTVLELFAGIGGLAAAWPEADVVAAVDINLNAKNVYLQNFAHPYWIREVESLADDEFCKTKADFWWMSPPCQPYTRRGRRNDLADPRSRGLLRVIEAIASVLPKWIGLENVVGFEDSQAWRILQRCLVDHGYQYALRHLCPSQMGWPNRRPRCYVLATRQSNSLEPWKTLPVYDVQLNDFVLENSKSRSQENRLEESEANKYLSALDRVDLNSPGTSTACFAASYGKTILHAGSYLQDASGYRRFSPREVARLLGFADPFSFEGVTTRTSWKLLGNGLSLPAVRYIVSHCVH